MNERQIENAVVLRKAKAWNWQWPDNHGRWDTKLSPRRGDPRTKFTSMGPSKRTVSRRAARARRSQ